MYTHCNQARGNLLDEQGSLGPHPAHLLFGAHPSSSSSSSSSSQPATRAPAAAPASLPCNSTHHARSRPSLALAPSLPLFPPPLPLPPSLSLLATTHHHHLPCFCRPRHNLRHRTSRRLPSPRSSPSTVSTPRLAILRYCTSLPHFPSSKQLRARRD